MTASITPNDNGRATPDSALSTSDGSIRSAQRAATAGVDGVAQKAHAFQQQALSALELGARRADEFAHQAAQKLQQGRQRLLDQAHTATSQTRHYIEREPVKAVLIAAATGAALMLLLKLLNSRNRY